MKSKSSQYKMDSRSRYEWICELFDMSQENAIYKYNRIKNLLVKKIRDDIEYYFSEWYGYNWNEN